MIRGRPSQTAEAVAFMRATDQRHDPAERILDDPYAALFLGRMLRAALSTWEATGLFGDVAERVSPGLAAWVLCRHRYIDDCLRHALQGGTEQVVLLGAGYDSRPYRFAREIAGRPVFEVDFPATSQRKARIAERNASRLPAVESTRVEIDFESESLPDKLGEAGFRRGRRTFFVWEGVSMYLTRDVVKSTLVTLRELSGPDGELVMDFWYLIDRPDLLATAYRMSANLLSLVGEPVTFGIHPEDVTGFLQRVGWDVVEIADEPTLQHRYVRDGRRVLPGSYVVHARVPASAHAA